MACFFVVGHMTTHPECREPPIVDKFSRGAAAPRDPLGLRLRARTSTLGYIHGASRSFMKLHEAS